VGGLSWFAIALLSLYLISSSEPLSAMRRGAVILLAVTVPMLWSRLLFQYFAKLILDIDASLVSLLLGSPRVGNVVRFADDSGSLLILPYCSSLHNVSLTILTWVFLGEWLEHRPSQRDLRWCVLAALSVIAVNVTRMSLMGLSDAHYRAIHSLTGDMIVNVLTLTLMVGFCLTGMRRESVSGR
jgi:exosortase/archaeosortase family protein